MSWSLLALQKDLLDIKLPEGNYQVTKTKKFQPVLNSWFSITTKRPQSVNVILTEYLLYRFFQVNKSCVKVSTLGNKKSLLHTKIFDIIDLNGQALKFDIIPPKLLNQIN